MKIMIMPHTLVEPNMLTTEVLKLPGGRNPIRIISATVITQCTMGSGFPPGDAGAAPFSSLLIPEYTPFNNLSCLIWYFAPFSSEQGYLALSNITFFLFPRLQGKKWSLNSIQE